MDILLQKWEIREIQEFNTWKFYAFLWPVLVNKRTGTANWRFTIQINTLFSYVRCLDKLIYPSEVILLVSFNLVPSAD